MYFIWKQKLVGVQDMKGTVVVPRPLARDFLGFLTVEMLGLYECTGPGVFFTLTVKLIRVLGGVRLDTAF